MRLQPAPNVHKINSVCSVCDDPGVSSVCGAPLSVTNVHLKKLIMDKETAGCPAQKPTGTNPANRNGLIMKL